MEFKTIGEKTEEHKCSCEQCTGSCSNINLDDISVKLMRNRSEIEAVVIDNSTGEILKDRMPTEFMARQNKLDYLSVSKIQAYEQCPACFYHTYMSDEGSAEDNSNFFTRFGSILHEVVELASRYYNESGVIIDPVSIYNEVWKNHDLQGFEPYHEGLGLIKDYFSRNPVDSRPDNAKFIEYEWRGELGGCTFGLMIDYAGIMKNNPEVGILKDYKTNRMPFTPSELEQSFQLRVYELVLRRFLAPEVKQWIAGYEMFRFGWQQCPPWTEDDLLEAEDYIANVWHQISNDNTWEEKLNNYCGFRKCRLTCKTYRDYVENPGRYIDAIRLDGLNLADIENERQLLTKYEKIAKTRKDECATILKSAIEDAMVQGKKLVIDGQELQLYSAGKGSYNYYETRNVLLASGKLDILDDCLTINKTKLDKAIASDANLKLQLAGCMSTNYASPYIVKSKYKPK